MKKLPLLGILLLLISFSYAQQICPILKVKNGALGLSSLDIKVEIVGNIATTTFDMLYYNPASTVLEGSLSFPLGEGHHVTRFALDVNGKLREAVVVEKELGRIAFENVVRRGVDPALLEKGTGNNYKARIYPIPAKGYKRIVLAYQQELIYSNNAHLYYIPLLFKNKLDSFSLDILVFDQEYKPILKNGGIPAIEFTHWKKNYTLKVTKKNFIANTPLTIKIPLSKNTKKILRDSTYFYIYKTISPKKRLREIPKVITLFWDASLSMQQRNLEKELKLLNEYFDYVKNIKVHFISFSNTIKTNKTFSIKNGNWQTLKKALEQTIYDGGTDYNTLSLFKNKSDINFLFTDGITTLSKVDFRSECPVFTVNSKVKSNHTALHNIAEITHGAYLNLETNLPKEAFLKTKYEPYQFLGYETNTKGLEIYPVAPVNVANDFSLTAKNIRAKQQLTLKFGYGNKVLERVFITIDSTKTRYKDLDKIWAQKKVSHLSKHSQKNKRLITQLGKKFSLVTTYTSLIVLDNVRDYARYQITPPDELLEAYNQLLAKKQNYLSSSRRLQFITGANMVNPISEDIEIIEEVIVEDNKTIEPFRDEVKRTPTLPNNTNELDEVVTLEVTEEDNEDIPFAIIEDIPIFPGCNGLKEELKRCFAQKVRVHFKHHFNSSIINSLNLSQGRHRVNTQFTINKQGEITQVKVRAEHRKLENEVTRIIQLLPKMQAGKQRGRPVSVRYILPIIFNIDTNGQFSQNEHIVIDNYSTTPVNKTSKYKKYRGKLIVKDRKLITKYLSELRASKNKEEAYAIYLKQRANYTETPSYFVDVSNFFKEELNANQYATMIASNIAEIDFDNYELLKIFAYQLQQNQQNKLAAFIYERILQLRPEDSQSYRDLALAYEAIGSHQKALNLYNDIFTGNIYKDNSNRRVFSGIKEIIKNETKHLIHLQKDTLNTSKIDKEFLKDKALYDIRITIDWNHNDTDIDLHIIDPMLEECFYKHATTSIGGKISEDMTEGFGPEEFTLKHAIKGMYYIKVNYYGDNYQKVENPTFMKVTIYKNYGSKNEIKKTSLIRLSKNDGDEIVASVKF